MDYPQRFNTLVFLPAETLYRGTRKHYSVVKVLLGLYHLDRMPSRGYALDMEKKPKPSALTVRFTAEEKAILTELRTFYGLSSDNEALRFALRAASRELHRLRAQAGSHTIPQMAYPPNHGH
jgi:hypothetical protein